MRVLSIEITPSDVRHYRIEPGYKYGIYQELDKPSPANTRLNLCVYRVPEGMTAPIGRVPDEVLLALAEQAALPVAQPEVLARLPYWSYIRENGMPSDVPDDTAVEPFRLMPASVNDRLGFYVQPKDAFTPLAPAPAKEPAKAEKAAAPAKEG